MKCVVFTTVKRSAVFITLLVVFCTLSIFFHYRQDFTTESQYGVKWQTFNKSQWKDSKKIINVTHFLPPVPSCLPGEGIRLVIIVCSAPQNFAARQAIRATWGKDEKWSNNSKMFFIIGRSREDMFVSTEKSEYGDIIQYNLIDSYYNLTLKSISILRWSTTHCNNAQYVMKTDDDMFVNVPLLLQNVLRRNISDYLVGKLISKARPIRDKSSKWYVPRSMYYEKYYPNYLSGTGYVMSQSATAMLYSASHSAPFISLEDVFITGICAKNSNVKPTDNQLFTYAKQVKNPCRFLSLVTAHRMTPTDLYEMWDLIRNFQLRCVSKFWNNLK